MSRPGGQGVTIEFRVADTEAGLRLGEFLRRRRVSLAVVRHQKYFEDGLQVNGCRARTSQVLAAGDLAALNLAFAPEFSALPEELPAEIVHEDAQVIVFNKPAGQLTHPAVGRHSGTLANAYCGLVRRREQAGSCDADRVFRPVGRLDADTSGLLLCAKNAAVAPLLAKSLQKEYLALVQGCPPAQGVYEFPISAAEGEGVRQAVLGPGRPSRTEYERVAAGDGASLMRVWPKTGRTHQIRVHFAHAGHPLLGDALYGGNTAALQRHALHCAAVRFTGLDGAETEVRAGLPLDMRQLCSSLKIVV